MKQISLFECDVLHLHCSKTVKLILQHLMHKEARFYKEISSLEGEQFSFWSVGRQKFSGLPVIWHFHFGILSTLGASPLYIELSIA